MEEERDDSDIYMLELVDLMLEDWQGVRSDKILEKGNHGKRDTRETRRSSIEEQKTLQEEDGPVTNILRRREVQVGSRVKSIADISAYRIEVKFLDVLQAEAALGVRGA